MAPHSPHHDGGARTEADATADSPPDVLAGIATWFTRHYTQYVHTTWPQTHDDLDDLARFALLPPGKLTRPLLLLHCTAALGGNLGHAKAVAVAIESQHVASLIHDDLIDKDNLRRGKPSLHTHTDTDTALLIADAILCRSFAGLAASDQLGITPQRKLEVIRVAGEAGVRACRGQLHEAQLRGDLHCGTEAYVSMARLKSASLLEGACLCAAAISGATPATSEVLRAYGEAVGITLQIHDDLLPYMNGLRTHDKPADSDLRNRRPTLPMLLAHERANPIQRRRLSRLFLSRRAHTTAVQAQMAAFLNELGAIEAAAALRDTYAATARAQLGMLPSSPHRDWLRNLTYAISAAFPHQAAEG